MTLHIEKPTTSRVASNDTGPLSTLLMINISTSCLQHVRSDSSRLRVFWIDELSSQLSLQTEIFSTPNYPLYFVLDVLAIPFHIEECLCSLMSPPILFRNSLAKDVADSPSLARKSNANFISNDVDFL